MASKNFQDRLKLNVVPEHNILDKFDQYGYSFRLSMINELHMTAHNFDYKKAPKRVLVQTGATSAYINSVTIQSVVFPNGKTLSALTNQFQIEIVEPKSSNFIDNMYNAALDLQIPNFHKTTFYLELWFHGSDPETGQPQMNVLEEFGFTNRYVWRLIINNIDISVEANGTTYQIAGFSLNDRAFDSDNGSLPFNIEIQGETIAEMVNDLEKKWNVLSEREWATSGRPLVQYEFVLYNNTESRNKKIINWKEARISNDKRTDPSATSNTQTNRPQMHFTPKESIQTIMNTLIANSSWAQEMRDLISAVDRNKPESGKQAKGSFPQTCTIESTVQYTNFDLISQDFNKKITFHIWPFDAITPVLRSFNAQGNQEELKQRAQQKIDFISSSRLVKKEYNYIFTGQNVDVIDFDFKINTSWVALIPTFLGRLGDDTYRTGPVFEKKTITTLDVSTTEGKLKRINELTFENKRRQETIQLLSGSNSRLQDPSTRLEIEFEQKFILENQQEINRVRTIQNDDFAKIDDLKFAEDIDFSNLDRASPIVPITTFENRQSVNQTSLIRGSEVRFQEGKNVMASIYNQIYDPNPYFLDISLDIRGDPYWLGTNHLTRLQQLVESAKTRQLCVAEPTPAMRDRFKEKLALGGNPLYEKEPQYIVFTMKSPSPDESDPDKVVLGVNRTMSGLYFIKEITSKFQNGTFSQTIQGVRDPDTANYTISIDRSAKPSVVTEDPILQPNNSAINTLPVISGSSFA